MNRALSIATNLFPVWVLLGGALALAHPAWFTWFSGGFITWGLAVIMLGMGITLSVDDFKRVLKMPRAVGIGFAAQHAIMPFPRPESVRLRTYLVAAAMGTNRTSSATRYSPGRGPLNSM